MLPDGEPHWARRRRANPPDQREDEWAAVRTASEAIAVLSLSLSRVRRAPSRDGVFRWEWTEEAFRLSGCWGWSGAGAKKVWRGSCDWGLTAQWDSSAEELLYPNGKHGRPLFRVGDRISHLVYLPGAKTKWRRDLRTHAGRQIDRRLSYDRTPFCSLYAVHLELWPPWRREHPPWRRSFAPRRAQCSTPTATI